MEYRVIGYVAFTDLTNAVNALIREGWEPQGGVAVACDERGVIDKYVQAMTRRFHQAAITGVQTWSPSPLTGTAAPQR